MKRLIVNADDFGMTPGVNRAIVHAHRNGIVTSTSLLANGLAFDDAVAAARENPSLGVGVHLNLTEGVPVGDPRKLAGLVNPAGEFAAGPAALVKRMLTRQIPADAIEHEFRAQIERVLASGIEPTHLDGHQHVHMWPPVFQLTARLAAEYGLAGVRSSRERRTRLPALLRRNRPFRGKIIRQMGGGVGIALLAVSAQAALRAAGVASPDYFYGVSATGYLDAATLEDILRDVPEGTSELMCHPGYVDAALARRPTRLLAQREKELEALTRPQARILIRECGIQLITYRDLRSSRKTR
jgi:hopanoid biosynthesis associated protein HpnK